MAQPTPTPPTITPHDHTIAHLQNLSYTLTTSIAALSSRIDSLSTSLSAALAVSNRDIALTYLRARKAAQATLLSREASLHQTQGVLDAIDDAATNVEMVKALEAGAGVLADLNAEVGGAEGVQRVMEMVREGVTEADEIAGAIREVGGEEVDEREVEEEMEALEREEREKIEVVRRAQEENAREALKQELPDAPAGVPEAKVDVDGAERDLNRKISGMSLDLEPHEMVKEKEKEPALAA